MKKFRNGILTLSFAFIMVMAVGVVNVNAAEYNLDDIKGDLIAGNPLTLTAEDTLNYNGEVWVGANGRLTVNSGTLTIKYDDAGTPGLDATNAADDTVLFTVDGSVNLNSGKQFIVQIELDGHKLPVNFTINDGSNLSVYGTLALPSGANSVLVNYGTVNVHESGVIEMRDRANLYQGPGKLNIMGKLVLYGNSGSNIGEQKIDLHYQGQIYSEADIYDNIVKGSLDTDYFTYDIVELENKYYDSITATVGNREFPYAYTLSLNQVSDIPVVDEEPTIPEEVTEEVSNEENPETSDGILLFLGLTVVGFAGTALAYRRLHN